MTEFEQQVADAIEARLIASPLEMFDELSERDIRPLADYLAPSLARALEVAAATNFEGMVDEPRVLSVLCGNDPLKLRDDV